MTYKSQFSFKQFLRYKFKKILFTSGWGPQVLTQILLQCGPVPRLSGMKFVVNIAKTLGSTCPKNYGSTSSSFWDKNFQACCCQWISFKLSKNKLRFCSSSVLFLGVRHWNFLCMSTRLRAMDSQNITLVHKQLFNIKISKLVVATYWVSGSQDTNLDFVPVLPCFTKFGDETFCVYC